MRDENMVAECLRHSDTVYNLVGRDFETKLARPSSPLFFEDIQTDGLAGP